MLDKKESIRIDTFITNSGGKYGVLVFKCKHCGNEILVQYNMLSKHKGFCKKCKNQIYNNYTSKICNTCNIEQPLSQFMNGKYIVNRCFRCNNLKRNYNITNDIYISILRLQDNKCAICHNPTNNKDSSLNVDHCHSTGKIRGLLCDNCNKGLGMFKDNINILEEAIKYLKT